MASGNPFRSNGVPQHIPGASSSRPFQQQQSLQQSALPPRSQQPGGSNSNSNQTSSRGHVRQTSSTSALSPAALRAAGGPPIPLSSDQSISHRHSPSIEQRGAWTPDRNQAQHRQQQQQQQHQQYGGHVHPGLYENASIPSSPDLQMNGNGGFFGNSHSQLQHMYPSSPASTSNRNGGGRGFKTAGVGLMGFGGRRQDNDDAASIASLIDRDGDDASYNGHAGGSDSGHTYSSHNDDGYLMPGVPKRVTNYPSISNKHISSQQLRTKTSYRDFKNSESKILSNEE